MYVLGLEWVCGSPFSTSNVVTYFLCLSTSYSEKVIAVARGKIEGTKPIFQPFSCVAPTARSNCRLVPSIDESKDIHSSTSQNDENIREQHARQVYAAVIDSTPSQPMGG